jgi:hypothetical protein
VRVEERGAVSRSFAPTGKPSQLPPADGGEGHALDPRVGNAYCVVKRAGFAGPFLTMQLVEGDDRPFRHSRKQHVESVFGRRIDVEVEIKQRDDEMRILVEVIAAGLQEIAFDDLDLGDVVEGTPDVEKLDGGIDVFNRPAAVAADFDLLVEAADVALRYDGKSLERIEPDDAAPVVQRLIQCLKVRPGEKAAAEMHAAFENGPLHVANSLKHLVLDDEPGERASVDKFWKGGKFRLDGVRRLLPIFIAGAPLF